MSNDELGWLNEIEPKESTRVEEELEPEEVKQVEEAKEKNPLGLSGPIAKKSLNEIFNKMGDKDFMMSENLHMPTCERLRNLLKMLIENDGEWVVGRKTLDGFVIQCPIHSYAPMYKCYDCEHWNGGTNPEGKCTRSMEDIDYNAPKFDHSQAQGMEVKHRQERSKLGKKEEGAHNSE